MSDCRHCLVWWLPRLADFLDMEHHELTHTVNEGIDAAYDLIWHLDSHEHMCCNLGSH